MNAKVKYGIGMAVFICTAAILCGILVAAPNVVFAQPASLDDDGRSVLIKGVTVFTAVGDPITQGAVGIKGDSIAFVGKAAQVNESDYGRVVERTGYHVYPAMIAANSTLGLTEIFAVRATRDFAEVGGYNPNVRALSAYNAESDVVATVLSNGIAFAQICPRGGVISGSSSVVKLKAGNWPDAAYRTDEGIHVNWPRFFTRKTVNNRREFVPNPDYIEEVRLLRAYLTEARAYGKLSHPVDYDLKRSALKHLFTGERRLYVHADHLQEIREAIALKRDLEIPKMTIVGGADAPKVTDLLRENGVSVLLGRVHSLPQFAEDPIDAPYAAPTILAEAGIVFALQMEGDMETMQNRNLALNAGTAMGYGLTSEQALKSVTIHPAAILGIDHRTGSIEVGKEANIILTKGDLFDARTGKIEYMYLQGRPTDLSNRQKDLYLQGLRRYGLPEKP